MQSFGPILKSFFYTFINVTWGQFQIPVCAQCQTVCIPGPTFETFSGVNVRLRVQKIGVQLKTVYEIDPRGTKS